MTAFRLGDIVAALGGELSGDADSRILRIAPLDRAQPGDITFLSNAKFRHQLAGCLASCIIVAPAFREIAQQRGPSIICADPYLYYARLSHWWKRATSRLPVAGIHPSAVVHHTAMVHPTASIGPLCVIEANVHIGEQTVLASRVTVGDDCQIGARCTIQPGAVIGGDGFGFAPNNGTWEKIEQLGSVRIGDDVEIGSNTCIDRGALDDTVIGDGVKIDNLVQIAHNVRIGNHTAMAGCVGVAGSTVIGAHCTFGGAAMVLGHLNIADGVNVSAASVVSRSLNKPGLYTGFFPLDENAQWEKNAVTLKQLHGIRDRVRALEKIQKND